MPSTLQPGYGYRQDGRSGAKLYQEALNAKFVIQDLVTLSNGLVTDYIALPAAGNTTATSSLIANPGTITGGALSDSATAGTWSSATSSTWEVAFTWVTAAGGESLPSVALTIALATASHSIGVASITAIPAGVVSVNAYVNGAKAFNQAVTANATGAFNIPGPSATLAATPPPTVSTAYVSTVNKLLGLAMRNARNSASNPSLTVGSALNINDCPVLLADDQTYWLMPMYAATAANTSYKYNFVTNNILGNAYGVIRNSAGIYAVDLDTTAFPVVEIVDTLPFVGLSMTDNYQFVWVKAASGYRAIA